MKTDIGRAGVMRARRFHDGPRFRGVTLSAVALCVWLAPGARAAERPTAIAAGELHTCVLTANGKVLCWGSNASGQLGDNSTAERLTPVAVSGLASGVTAIAAGFSHSCAITAAGGQVCWGKNGDGQLGNNSTVDSPVPVEVSGLTSGVTGIFAGWRFTHAIVSGAVRSWGQNTNAQLGAGYKNSWELSPVNVPGLSSGVLALAGGRYHGCALTTAAAVLCWGFNADGQLGDGTNAEHLAPSPSNVTIGAVKLVAGSRHTCMVTAGGAARCWGWNANGQLGNGDTTNRSAPTAVNGLAGWPPQDVDGDAKSDVVWWHTSRGEVWLWPMDGAARTAETWVRTVPDTGWAIRGVGDYDGDGKADILWRHPANGELWVWMMDGATPQEMVYAGIVDPGYEVVGSGDLNGDGWCDVVWRHKTNGEVWVWLMDGATRLSQTWVATVPDVGYQIVMGK